MKTQTLLKKQQTEAFSYEELRIKNQEEDAYHSEYTDKQLLILSRMPLALKACLVLRDNIESQPFGHFFKHPVNPYALGLRDYWVKVRKPIDLATIKRKFFTGIYRKIVQFDSDMKLMFDNALSYNHHQDTLVTQIASLREFYQRQFQEIQDKILTGVLSEDYPPHAHRADPMISQFSEQQLKNIFNTNRRERLGGLLEFMQNHNRNKIKNMLMNRYPELQLHTVKKRNALFLNQMRCQQVWDILRECKDMGENDFDTAQLSKVEREAPDLEGYNQFHYREEGEKESSFEVEDESAND